MHHITYKVYTKTKRAKVLL